jgi:hypothetical protein
MRLTAAGRGKAMDRRPQAVWRISIANSDAAAMPLTQAAFDIGYRAVQEVYRGRLR